MAPTNTTISFCITTSMPVLAPAALDSDMCKCGHVRREHDRKRGRCTQQNWRNHRCNCSLFRRPQ